MISKPALQIFSGRPEARQVRQKNLKSQITDFLQAKRRKWRPKTYSNYRSILNLYAAHVGPNHWPPTRRGVLSWLDALDASGCCQTTINTYWIHLRAFLNFLEKSGEITPANNPVHQIVALELDPEPEDLPPVSFPDDDLDRLFEYLETEAATGDLYAIRDLAILRLAYITGAREGEIARLTLERRNLDNYEAIILAWTSKGKKLRTIYYDDQVYLDLKAWLEVRPEQPGVQQLFVSLGGRNPRGSPMNPDALYDVLQRRCDQAGIPRRRFHALRHSSALDALDEGISLDKVQKQLGHASIQTTMRYLRGRDPDRARAYREHSLSKRLRQNKKKPTD
ncbi:MAG: tyrosine-type recombinase/integrase [Anaerolineae bacterium]|nr:tyrosine-type recombinase/integrase [Anaerolineae bacterium]